ncbi:DUF443 family protein [Staphylococcus epidermidis]|uniref:DUF443 family protein n=1 Tax=Staphylococcus TaxID=1279 RepID=UPI001F3C9EE7|nr:MULTISPECIES: DUF443 family protein [Staphylococcus]MCF7580993.1 DUF443 family protein [Staphylococcus epidermidis]MCH1573126.1 DUF443 family protein [Staphylococcus epidermidis]MCH1606268.1 DUF443 family protein [Staphylococcus epidermidis]MDH9506262.1 DUF443 family protein [Staphylococcus epidermidis]MDH9511272.1 DUF443 family protein [Staphylococcus epidermidis]
MIDLNRNKLTYIFPLLNYLMKQVLIEIDKNEISKVKTDSLKKNKTKNAITSLSIGASVLIGYLVKSLGNYLDFSTTYTLNIILILIAIVPILLIKGVVNKNKKFKLQLYLKNDTFRAHVLPNNKEVVKNILLNFIVTFLFVAMICGFIFQKESNFIYLIAISLLLATILFQNVLLYAQTEISGKIGKVKSKP